MDYAIYPVNPLSIALWASFGLIAGILAYLSDPHEQKGGLTSALVASILGSVLGGSIASLLFEPSTPGPTIGSLFISLLGGVALVVTQNYILRKERKLKKTIDTEIIDY